MKLAYYQTVRLDKDSGTASLDGPVGGGDLDEKQTGLAHYLWSVTLANEGEPGERDWPKPKKSLF